MIEYSKANAKSIAAAVAKCKAKDTKPTVKPVKDAAGLVLVGHFDVQGQPDKKGRDAGKVKPVYRVTFGKRAGEFVADCTCEAGAAGKVCYHAVACSAVFKQQVHNRAAAQATAPDLAPAIEAIKAGSASIAAAMGFTQADIDRKRREIQERDELAEINRRGEKALADLFE